VLAVVLLALAGLAACSGKSKKDQQQTPAIQTFAGTGVRWISGANANFPADIQPWSAWTGRSVDLALTFVTRTSWGTVVSPDWPLSAFTRDKWPGQLSLAVPLWPVDDAGVPVDGANENDCAAGAYDEHFAQLGRNLQKYGRPDAIIRLGWEFNGDWFRWFPHNVDTWKECYRREVTALRSTAPQVQIDWTMSMHRDTLPDGTDVWAAYPGDDVVDIIGVDYYDMSPPAPTEKIWDDLCDNPSGLCNIIKEARAHGKKFSVPEWGVVSADGGGGDNAFFVDKMYATFRANADVMAYESYWNNHEADNVHSSLLDPVLNPKSAKRYQQLFGAG